MGALDLGLRGKDRREGRGRRGARGPTASVGCGEERVVIRGVEGRGHDSEALEGSSGGSVR